MPYMQKTSGNPKDRDASVVTCCKQRNLKGLIGPFPCLAVRSDRAF